MPDDASVVPFRPRDPGPVSDVSYEVALDPEPSGAVVPVEPPAPRGELLPVIPVHLQSVAGVKAAVARQAGRHWHRAKYHGLRSPRYVLLVVFWALVGAVRLVGAWVHWWLSPVPVEAHLDARKEGNKAVAGTLKLHLQMTKTRAAISLAVIVVAGGAYVLLSIYVPLWLVVAVLAVVALPLLARAGLPADRHIVTAAVVTPRFRKLNADIVLRAYYAAGLGKADKPDQQVTFGSTMARDGEGTGVLVDLPYGLSLKNAVDAKDKIASGLDVTESQVFIHRDPTSARRHRLWVADRDPLAVPVGRTPLLACRATDIWKPAPFGLDERGQLVTVPLMWHSILVSALPRAGKTFSARLLALFAALDPYTQLDVFDFKGSPDWRKFAQVAESCAFGLTPTKDGLPADIFRDTLERLKADAQDRYRRLSELADRRPELCPEGKLTRKLARNPEFEMPVRMLVMDEFQEVYDIGEPSKEIASLLTFLVKVAPGAGIILVDATQRPSGVGTGHVAQQFTSFRDNHAVKFGLRTSSWQVSELCLGAGAYSEGLDTSTLLPQYKGVGILRGAGDASPTVRTYLADGQDADRILTAARAMREQAGTLSGMAAGVVVEKAARDILGDVLAVFSAGETGAQWQVLAVRLAARFPERWKDADADSVSAAVRALGVESKDIKYMGRVLKGCRKDDVEAVSRR